MSVVNVMEDLPMFSWNWLGYSIIAGLMLLLIACRTKPQPQPPTENIEPTSVERAPPNPEEQVAKMMKDFNRLLEEGSFEEAAKVAQAAQAIAPNDPTANAAVVISRPGWHHRRIKANESDWKDPFYRGMIDAEDSKFISDVKARSQDWGTSGARETPLPLSQSGNVEFLFTHQDRAIGFGIVTSSGPSVAETGKPGEGKPLPEKVPESR